MKSEPGKSNNFDHAYDAHYIDFLAFSPSMDIVNDTAVQAEGTDADECKNGGGDLTSRCRSVSGSALVLEQVMKGRRRTFGRR